MIVETYSDRENLDYYIPIALGIFSVAYKDKGVWLVDTSIPSLKRKIQEIKLVKHDKDIAAIAVFSDRKGGLKCTGIAGNKLLPKSVYKEAIELLMRTIIDYDDSKYWIECSEAIEHYCKRFGGNPIPASFVCNELGFDVSGVDYDTYHYDRFVGKDKDIKVTKCMYGFRDNETREKVVEYLSGVSGINYEQYKHDIKESSKDIRQIIYNIADLHDDYEIYELSEEMEDVLKQGTTDKDMIIRKISKLLLEEMELFVRYDL